MALLKGNHHENITRCLPGFQHINRYWDRRRQAVVAKILPGEFYVTVNDEWVGTVLGSCVSACMWDEKAGVGGMNHFMLPLTDKKSGDVCWGSRNVPGDATRYGNHAMEHLINEILKHGGRRESLQAKVFGGAKVLKQMTDVGARNASFVLEYLKLEHIPVVSQDLNQCYPRKLLFNPVSGKVLMKKLVDQHNDTIMKREITYSESIVKKPVEGDIELFQ